MQLNFLIFFLEMCMLNLVCSEETTPTVDKFILNTATCQIPDLNQWSYKKFHKSKAYVPCDTYNSLVRTGKLNGRYYVLLDKGLVPSKSNNSIDISCWISNITRGLLSEVPDNEIMESRAIPFESHGRVEISKDTVKVKCYKVEKNSATVIYENIFGTYVPFNVIEKQRIPITQKFNVLMIAIDSLSKYNFIKMMPKTYEYLKKKDYQLLYGYSQLDRVALPNIVPLLTGYSMRDAILKYGNPIETFFDAYDFIWYEFEKYGYVTAFAEDYSQINTFNRQYKGFWSTPTNYYFRPLTLATELMNTTTLDNMPHCTGPESAAERVLKLASSFVEAFHEKPHFGLFWLNSFSHDDYNAPGRMDAKMKEFFQNIASYLNGTIVILFSDHGYSKETVTDDPLGLYESISPLCMVHLPETFKVKYQELTKKFIENSNNLVSPYDLYATLQDILVLSDTNHSPKKPKSCPKCKSLFREISKTRSCKDVGVSEDWCICWKAGTLRAGTNVEEEKSKEDAPEEGDEDDDKEIKERGGTSKMFEKSVFSMMMWLNVVIMYLFRA